MSNQPMTGLEKVALLMKSLPGEVVEKVLRHMEPGKAGRVNSALAEVGKRPDLQESMSQVLDEAFEVLAAKPESSAKPDARSGANSVTTPRIDIRIGQNANDPEPKKTPEPSAESDPLLALVALDADVLAKALDNENAHTVSILMDRMDVEIAGQIYKRLSGAKRKEVSLRFTEPTVVNEELTRRIAMAVLRKCQILMESPTATALEENGREKRMAGLLRNLERAERIEMLTVLEETDAELAGRLKEMLYQFEDILRMVNTSIQKLLSEIDMQTLAIALRGAQPEIHERIMANLSKRAQTTLKEEIELTANLPVAKVREARKAMEVAIQRLDQREELVLTENG